MVFAEVGKTGARNENHIDEKWGSTFYSTNTYVKPVNQTLDTTVGGKCSGHCVKPCSLHNNTVSSK